MEQMVAALTLARTVKNGKPKCIFGHTIKGKGISYMENQCGWHGKAPNAEQYQQAREELEEDIRRAESAVESEQWCEETQKSGVFSAEDSETKAEESV